MLTLRAVQKLQDLRSLVQLEDGRVGKIVRVDTMFPGNRTVVSVYTQGEGGPGIAKVGLDCLSLRAANS
jgi:hypothetical protein